MYINKFNLKARSEKLMSGDTSFIISLTGDMNHGDYTSTFQLIDKEDGIKAIEELCMLHEWELTSQDESGRIPNFNSCPIDFVYLEIPCNEINDYCHTITDSKVYRIDEYGKIFSVEIGEDFDADES